MSRRTRALAQLAKTNPRHAAYIRVQMQAKTLTPEAQGFPAPGQYVMLREPDYYQKREWFRVITGVHWLGCPDEPKGVEIESYAVYPEGERIPGSRLVTGRHELTLLLDPAGREYVRHPAFAEQRATGRK